MELNVDWDELVAGVKKRGKGWEKRRPKKEEWRGRGRKEEN